MGIKNVPKYAEEHEMSTEDAARKLRYEFLYATACEIGANKIATAHHQDDQIETIMMRLIRGSGITGLVGIPEGRAFKDKIIIRPLLKVSRDEIDKYAKNAKLKNIEDETNEDEVYLRNSLRKKLVPLLKEYNPNLADTLGRMSAVLAEDDDYLLAAAKKVFEEGCLVCDERGVRIDAKSLKNYPLSMQRRVIRLGLEKLNGKLTPISLDFIANFLKNNLTTIQLDDAQNIHVSKDII